MPAPPSRPAHSGWASSHEPTRKLVAGVPARRSTICWARSSRPSVWNVSATRLAVAGPAVTKWGPGAVVDVAGAGVVGAGLVGGGEVGPVVGGRGWADGP